MPLFLPPPPMPQGTVPPFRRVPKPSFDTTGDIPPVNTRRQYLTSVLLQHYESWNVNHLTRRYVPPQVVIDTTGSLFLRKNLNAFIPLFTSWNVERAEFYSNIQLYKYYNIAHIIPAPSPEPVPVEPMVDERLSTRILDIKSPIVLNTNLGPMVKVPRGRSFYITVQGYIRFNYPKEIYGLDALLISIKDSQGVLQKYKDPCLKMSNSYDFIYEFNVSTGSRTGPWTVSFIAFYQSYVSIQPYDVGFVIV